MAEQDKDFVGGLDSLDQRRAAESCIEDGELTVAEIAQVRATLYVGDQVRAARIELLGLGIGVVQSWQATAGGLLAIGNRIGEKLEEAIDSTKAAIGNAAYQWEEAGRNKMMGG